MPSATATRAARPELQAHDQAARLELAALVQELTELLGAKLVAYIAGVKEVRAVREWSTGERTARSPVPERLRFAYQVAWLIAHHDSPAVARAWLQGLNPQLDDRSAARLLRDGDLEEVGPLILAAARAFIAGG